MLGKKITTNFVFNIMSMVLSFASSVFIARLGGAALFGNISLATSFQSLIRSLFIHSISNAHLKVYNDDQSVGLKNLLILNVFFNLVSSLIIGAFVFCNIHFKSETFSTLQLNLIIIFIVQDYLAMPLFLYIADKNAKLNVAKANRIDFIGQFFINAAKIATVLIGFKEVGIAWGIILACLMGSVYPVISLVRNRFGTFSMEISKRYLKYAFYISTSALAYGLLLSFDKILLGLLSVAPEQIGYYNAGNRLGVMLMSLGVSVGGIFMAVFTKNLVEKNAERSVDQLKQYERYVTIVFLPVLMVPIFFGREILGIIYGSQFQEAYVVLVLSLIVAYLKTLTIPYQNYLFANNLFKDFNRVSIIFSVSIVCSTTLFALSGLFPNSSVAVASGLVVSCLLERMLFVHAAAAVESRIKLFFHPGILLFFCLVISIWLLSERIDAPIAYLKYYFRSGILLLVIPIGFLFKVYRRSDLFTAINLVKGGK